MKDIGQFSLRSVAVLILGIYLIILSFSSYLEETGGTNDDVTQALLVALVISIFWIVGGFLNRRSFSTQHKWRRGLWLVIASLPIFILLIIGHDNAANDPHAKALFKLARYLMLSGLILTSELLFLNAQRHSQSAAEK